METQALGSAPRESCAFSWLCLHVGPNAPAWIHLFFTFSFSSLRLFLLVLSSWKYPSVRYSFWCYCLDASVFLFPFSLVFSFYSVLLFSFFDRYFLIYEIPLALAQLLVDKWSQGKCADGLNRCSCQSQNI